MKEIIDEIKIVKTDDNTYKYISNLEIEMTKEEFEGNIEKLKNQIKLANKILTSEETEKKIEKRAKELQQEHKVRKEALKNFDKYFEEVIKEELNRIKNKNKNKEQEREALKERVERFNEEKELLLNQLRTKNENFLDQFRIQKDKDSKILEIYNNTEAINNGC